jgi:hypothetical protein
VVATPDPPPVDPSPVQEITVTRSTFAHNQARPGKRSGSIEVFGGALYGTAIRLVRSTLSNNVAGGEHSSAGGVFIDSVFQAGVNVGRVEMLSSTFVENRGFRSDHVQFRGTMSDSRVALFAEGRGPGPGCRTDGYQAPLDNMSDDRTCAAYNHDTVVPNLKLRRLMDNGGPTATHALKPSSPAIDASGGEIGDEDQRGRMAPVALRRPSTPFDIGAFELQTLGRRCHGRRETTVDRSQPGEIVGTPGRDVIVGSRASETIRGQGGRDLVCAGVGNDFVLGRAGSDRLYGEAGNDALDGGDDADTLFGGLGSDACAGNSGRDSLHDCES